MNFLLCTPPPLLLDRLEALRFTHGRRLPDIAVQLPPELRAEPNKLPPPADAGRYFGRVLSTDHTVCANSKNNRGDCSGELTWPEAKQFCEEQSARLCSQQELFNDDTHGYVTRYVATDPSVRFLIQPATSPICSGFALIRTALAALVTLAGTGVASDCSCMCGPDAAGTGGGYGSCPLPSSPSGIQHLRFWLTCSRVGIQ